jgi:hypothetical protein
MRFTPLRKTSGTEPQGHAITGVPQASASIMAKPNGSGPIDGEHQGQRVAKELVLRPAVSLDHF